MSKHSAMSKQIRGGGNEEIGGRSSMQSSGQDGGVDSVRHLLPPSRYCFAGSEAQPAVCTNALVQRGCD
eukprot:1191670-Prorocentrum_minimum.AAC.4